MARGREGSSDDSSSASDGYRHGLENEERLRALGEAVDEHHGVKRPRRRTRAQRLRRGLLIGLLALVVLIVAVAGGGYLYARNWFGHFQRFDVPSEVKPISGQPFNILVVGSDSRAGLSGEVGAQTGASANLVSGQRSDVVKIVHVDPSAGTISIVSIPRDTMVTLLANQSLYGNANRINVNFGNGPALLAKTITANFGIVINDTVVVSFAGLINAADVLGGVYLDFPYPAADPYSGLRIRHAGCQLVKGFQALAVVRSRHYYYDVKGDGIWPGNNASAATLAADGWVYDPTSDFGRIDRQSAFLRAMVEAAKRLYNPFTIQSFLSKLPEGISLDQNFSLDGLIGLALRFHSLSANAIDTYTLPTVPYTSAVLGDVLYVQQPESQQLLVDVFGSGLQAPTNPPPSIDGGSPAPPSVTTTTIAPVTSGHPTTTTTNPTLALPSFDPRPCDP